MTNGLVGDPWRPVGGAHADGECLQAQPAAGGSAMTVQDLEPVLAHFAIAVDDISLSH